MQVCQPYPNDDEEKISSNRPVSLRDRNLDLPVLKANISPWIERWFLSSNAKDIGTLYLIFALFSGLLGTAFSVLIRLELSGPGVQYIADNQLYNAIITAHAILMIFFMVENFRFNFKSQPCLNTNKIGGDNNNILIIGEANNLGGSCYAGPKTIRVELAPQKYVKILVNDPFNNRDVILKIAKKQKGIYIWESLDSEHMYVGHSINLYNRISSYFMPSILKTKSRRVLRYLNKHGFSNIKLIIYIMDENSSLEEVVDGFARNKILLII